jgi:hypothetical protein
LTRVDTAVVIEVSVGTADESFLCAVLMYSIK